MIPKYEDVGAGYIGLCWMSVMQGVDGSKYRIEANPRRQNIGTSGSPEGRTLVRITAI